MPTTLGFHLLRPDAGMYHGRGPGGPLPDPPTSSGKTPGDNPRADQMERLLLRNHERACTLEMVPDRERRLPLGDLAPAQASARINMGIRPADLAPTCKSDNDRPDKTSNASEHNAYLPSPKIARNTRGLLRRPRSKETWADQLLPRQTRDERASTPHANRNRDAQTRASPRAQSRKQLLHSRPIQGPGPHGYEAVETWPAQQQLSPRRCTLQLESKAQ